MVRACKICLPLVCAAASVRIDSRGNAIFPHFDGTRIRVPKRFR
jgi:hypothetical protein